MTGIASSSMSFATTMRPSISVRNKCVSGNASCCSSNNIGSHGWPGASNSASRGGVGRKRRDRAPFGIGSVVGKDDEMLPSSSVSCKSNVNVVKSAATTIVDNSKTDLLVEEKFNIEEQQASSLVADSSPKTNSMNIVFVASEVAPWSKTGGLADVCGALPSTLVSRGHRVMVVAPRYGMYPDAIDTNIRFHIDIFQGNHEVGIFHCIKNGVDFVFVDHPSFLRPGKLYGDDNGTYGDNQFRYTLLSRAALEIPLQVPLSGTKYGEDCVFVANDWHAGMVPLYLAAKYRRNGVYGSARSMIVIHNMFHQGVFPPGTFENLHLHGDWFAALDYQYPEWARNGAYEEEGHSVNYLKGAICTADRVLTVSPGYAWEMTTKEGGWGLDGLLKSRSYHLNGIVNGLDIEDWNPATDKFIPANYDAGLAWGDLGMSGKKECKAQLQKEMGLPIREDVPVIGFIGRLDYQKGADLLLRLTPWLMNQDVQLIMLGTGEKWLEDGFRAVEAQNKEKARGWVGFNVEMSHKITAAADILLMPSRFEPCGLNQLYAMRYGTVPVVHATGGLRDTVKNYDPWQNTGTGWTFTEMNEESAKTAISNAIRTFRDHKESFYDLQVKGMVQDMSWDNAAKEYEKIFEWALMDPPYAS